MSNILPTETVEINERFYTLRALSFAEARKVMTILSNKLAMYASHDEVALNLGPTLALLTAEYLKDADIEQLFAVFGPTTSVQLGPDRAISLNSAQNRESAFAGRFDDAFAWLDAAIKFSFAATIAKMNGARAAQAQARTPTAGN